MKKRYGFLIAVIMTAFIPALSALAQEPLFKNDIERAYYGSGYKSGKAFDSMYADISSRLEAQRHVKMDKARFSTGFEDAVLNKKEWPEDELKESATMLILFPSEEHLQRVTYNLGFLGGKEFRNGLYNSDLSHPESQFLRCFGYRVERDMIVLGLLDYINQSRKLSDEEIAESIKRFEETMEEKASVIISKTRDDFVKKAGVVETKSGLLYRIDKAGAGKDLNDKDFVVVKYSGQLPDGNNFDGSYLPSEIQLVDLPSGWREGIKRIKKGGKVTLFVPPELGRPEQIGMFESMVELGIELIDVYSESDSLEFGVKEAGKSVSKQ